MDHMTIGEANKLFKEVNRPFSFVDWITKWNITVLPLSYPTGEYPLLIFAHAFEQVVFKQFLEMNQGKLEETVK